MTCISLRFTQNGKAWFEGKKMNQNFEEARLAEFGYLYDDSLYSDDESDGESDN